jgi:phosphate starvation-inducible PhoH-like protein
VSPYLRPLFDALFDLLDPQRVQKFVEQGIIEVAPLAYMRGRTLSDAFVILDEAQNTTREQMKMFLTRMGERAWCVVTGDPSQVDLPGGTRSGLMHASSVLRGVPGIAQVRFSEADVMRHPLVQDIVRAYAKDEAERERARQERRERDPGGDRSG